MKYANPYTPGAGFMPAYLAGRENLIDAAESYLNSIMKRYPQQSVIYYGLRGVGKTVLLNTIEGIADNYNILYKHIEIAEKGNFKQQIANSCKRFLQQMSIKESAREIARKTLALLKIFTLTHNPQEGTFSAGIEKEFEEFIGTGNLSDDLTCNRQEFPLPL